MCLECLHRNWGQWGFKDSKWGWVTVALKCIVGKLIEFKLQIINKQI